MTQEQTKSIFVSIAGRPNVGKSSLLNYLVGERLAIVTAKPQTTRSKITGILTLEATQYVFMDSPGFHQPRTRLGARMNRTAEEVIRDGDAIMMVFEATGSCTAEETEIMNSLKKSGIPALAVINKIDLSLPQDIAKQTEILAETKLFKDIVPVSALSGSGCDTLLEVLKTYAAEGPHFFPEDAYTDLTERYLLSEIIREKLLLNLQQELPHGMAVEIDSFLKKEDKPLVNVEATIYCEKKSHKGMVIGKQGQMLRTIEGQARHECEALLGLHVRLKCWVKVREGWRDNDVMLDSMGFKKR